MRSASGGVDAQRRARAGNKFFALDAHAYRLANKASAAESTMKIIRVDGSSRHVADGLSQRLF